MAKAKVGAYWFKPPWIVAVILAVIPVANWWLGFIHRLVRRNLLGAVVFFFFGAILGFIDFVTILLWNKVSFLA